MSRPEGGGGGVTPTNTGDVQSPEYFEKKRMEKLEKKLEEPTFQYLNTDNISQLRAMVKERGIFPVNAIKLIERRTQILKEEEFPAELLHIDCSELPKRDAGSDSTYSPIDYLATCMPGVSLFPLRQLQKIQRYQLLKQLETKDHLELRKKYQEGTVEIKTKLNPKAYDVQSLRGVSPPADLVALVENINACQDNDRKKELLKSVITERIQARIDFFDKALRDKTSNPEDKSKWGKNLQEIIDPENLDYLLDKIATTSSAWAEPRKPEAELAVLQPNLETYINLFKSNPYWFANFSEQTINKMSREFEKLLRKNIEDELDTMISHSALKRILKPSYYDNILSKPTADIIREYAKKKARELARTTEDLLRNALRGGDAIFDIADLLDVTNKSLDKYFEKKERTKKDKLDEDTAEAQADAEAENYAEIIQFPAKPEDASPTEKYGSNNLPQKLAKLIEMTQLITEGLTKEQKPQFSKVLRLIADLQLKNTVDAAVKGGGRISTGDLYSITKPYTKNYPLFRLLSRIEGEEKALGYINRIMETKLGELNDEDFAKLYIQLYDKTEKKGRQVFSQFILPREFKAPGTQNTMVPNRLPSARDRLLDLIDTNPEWFPEKLIVMGKKTIKKETTE